MNDNFVNIVGYQLEKVHTGVIKWVLESRNQLIPMTKKYEVLSRLYQKSNKVMEFSINDIHSIECIPEYSFGRQLKIDLVIDISLVNDRHIYLVMEMKVDSIPREKQLENTFQYIKNELNNSKYEIKAEFFLVLFGSSQVCLPSNKVGFKILILDDIINIFEQININNKIYIDWMAALKEERDRKDQVVKLLKQTKAINDGYFWDKPFWDEKGYRTWFPLFYYLYDKLREQFDNSKTWSIDSGSNNPVMSWDDGLLNKVYNGYKIQFYWEFNYEKFLLKVMRVDDGLSDDMLDALKNEVIELCQPINGARGSETQKRHGTYNSIYKWEFNFRQEDFSDIAREVEAIIDSVYPKLQTKFRDN